MTREGKSGIVDIIEMYRKSDPIKRTSKPVGRAGIQRLTIGIRKQGADVLICEYDDEYYNHLIKNNATAVCIDNLIVFRPDATISEVLEERLHFEQNLQSMNSDKDAELRSILNEIEAREYILKNATKFSVPRVEVEEVLEQFDYYKKLLEKYGKEKGNAGNQR